MKNIEGNIVDVVGKRIFEGEVLIDNDKIYDIREKQVESKNYILPGLIDAHVHIESSMLVPSQFARLAVRQGTVATVSDPHEIANVLGVEGIDFMINDAAKVPLKIYFGASSCVPATDLETSGAKLDSYDIKNLLERDDIYYLAEMMDAPGVYFGDEQVHKKLEYSCKADKPIDGHAPQLSGENLKKYADTGITTDHESTTPEEAIEKIKLGIKLQIREGSAAKNFDALYSFIDTHTEDVMLCTDDSHPDDLVEGHINKLLKKGIEKGVDIFNILQTATVNPIKHYGLEVGMLQKNDFADLVVVKDLKDFEVLQTYINGELVFNENEILFEEVKSDVLNNFNCLPISEIDIKIEAQNGKIRVIEAIDGELLTKKLLIEPKRENGFVVSDIKNDILKIVVVNRYKHSKPAVGFIKGFGLKKGAIAGSIAHDSHNIIAIGCDDKYITKAINHIIENKGGILVCYEEECMDLKLSIAGLMTNENGFEVAKKYKMIDNQAKKLGSKLKSPFMTMAFMSLLVIPELKLGDKGLFDVMTFSPTSLFI